MSNNNTNTHGFFDGFKDAVQLLDTQIYTCIFCGIKKDRLFHTNDETIKRIRKEKGFVCGSCSWNVLEILETNKHGGIVDNDAS